jgi:hypothetical protein
MKACTAAAAPSIKFNMRIHMTAGKALKVRVAAKKATKATKAFAKDIKKAMAKDGKKAMAKNTKKGNANDSKEGHNEAQGVLDLYVEELDLYNLGLEKVEMGPSNTNTSVSSKAMSKIEKTLSNLSMDQV